jgi:AbrB family looped-hinge helix DNA binding protein
MCIKGELDGEPGKGCTSPRREGISFIRARTERDEEGKELLIRLDKKGRLVLPLEIRDSLGVTPGDRVLLRIGSLQGGIASVRISRADPEMVAIPCSRNAGYIRRRVGAL